ncbi:acyl-CoA dehydrogenase family protein [Halocynthiibacter namhaensis]|uniref:acyl-CoA dehydrogenase family protein n=1 Tax=Halocynthiibacter namhaensis TaxID=1290553 RepID=UPI000B092BC3|nr:acyl-CoA dehydrogenase family protein [Halocynthiibacter namhaensis]
MIRRRIFTQDHDIFRASVVKWATAEIIPFEADWRRAGQVSRDLWKSAGNQGYLAMHMPEAHGGLALDDFRYDQILAEELAWRSPGFFLSLHNRMVAPYFLHVANAEQQARFVPGITSGDSILAIAMTEPSTGSDLGAIRTRADDHGDHWVLNGSKTFISNGLLADVIVVAARSDPDTPRAIGLFIVERGMPGFTRGDKLEKLGQPSQDTAELFFDDVKIPKSNQLGDAGQGFSYMMRGLAEERLTGSIGFLARAQRGLVPLTFRSLNSFMRPFAQKPRDFSRQAMSGDGAGYRTR